MIWLIDLAVELAIIFTYGFIMYLVGLRNGRRGR